MLPHEHHRSDSDSSVIFYYSFHRLYCLHSLCTVFSDRIPAPRTHSCVDILYRWMFVCCGSHVKVYSYSSGKVAYTLDHHTKEVTGVALHPRNRMQVYILMSLLL